MAYLIDSNVLVSTVISTVIEVPSNELTQVQRFQNLTPEERIIPEFIVLEFESLVSKSLVSRPFFKDLKKEILKELHVFIKNIGNRARVLNYDSTLLQKSIDSYISTKKIYYKRDLTLTDITFAHLAQEKGLDILTADKNLIKYFNSLS